MPCTYSVVSLTSTVSASVSSYDYAAERQREEERKRQEDERKKKEIAQKKKALLTAMVAMGFDLDAETVDSDKTLITGTKK